MKINNMIRAYVPYIIIALALSVLFVYPFWWMLVNSLNEPALIFGKPSLLPKSWS